MNRKLFLRNALMAVAVSLVPKILQPSMIEVKKVLSIEGLYCLADEYVLVTLKMQHLVNQIKPRRGEHIFWENEQWKELDRIKSQKAEEIREYFKS